MKPALLLLLLLLLAEPRDPAYDGKYVKDPRFEEIKKRMPELRARAVARIGAVLGRKIADTFLVRFQDSGADRSGRWAEVRTEVKGGKPRSVLILRTEHLVLRTHDLLKTLVHELYHCLQRERLGETAHRAMPEWAREGAALYVAGQLAERARLLAVHVGRDPRLEDPVASLVDGLGGRHTLEDYAEDASAFHAAEKRHGKEKAVALLRRLLQTPDVERAVREVLEEDFATFERAASQHARALLDPLVREGRKELLQGLRRLKDRDHAGALEVLEASGAYGPTVAYYRALALFRLEHHHEALEALRANLPRRETLRDNAFLLELRILKAMGSPEFKPAAARARLDLEPFGVYPQVEKLLGG